MGLKRRLMDGGFVFLGLALLGLAVAADALWMRALAVGAFLFLGWAWEP